MKPGTPVVFVRGPIIRGVFVRRAEIGQRGTLVPLSGGRGITYAAEWTDIPGTDRGLAFGAARSSPEHFMRSTWNLGQGSCKPRCPVGAGGI